MGFFYGTSAVYGLGVGSWLSLELDVTDPGVFLIAPAVLGVAAPTGVYLSDQWATFSEGLPAAISAGMVIGAGEGIGIAGLHETTVSSDQLWGIRGMARTTTLGATLGGLGGAAVGYYMEPEVTSTVLTTSGIFWGTAIGSFFGYGASPTGGGWEESNDYAAIGGLVGYNVGLGITGALGALWVPSWEQIGWMWAGAGIGAAASLPVFLLYAGEGGPPAKRGLLFTGTATLLGLGMAGALAPGDDTFGVGFTEHGPQRRWVAVTHMAPTVLNGGVGVVVGGVLF